MGNSHLPSGQFAPITGSQTLPSSFPAQPRVAEHVASSQLPIHIDLFQASRLASSPMALGSNRFSEQATPLVFPAPPQVRAPQVAPPPGGMCVTTATPIGSVPLPYPYPAGPQPNTVMPTPTTKGLIDDTHALALHAAQEGRSLPTRQADTPSMAQDSAPTSKDRNTSTPRVSRALPIPPYTPRNGRSGPPINSSPLKPSDGAYRIFVRPLPILLRRDD